MNNILPNKNSNSSPSQLSSFNADLIDRHQGKSSSQNYIRTTFYLPKDLHKQLKMFATQKDRDMSGIIEDLLNDWLKAESQHYE